MKFLNHIQMHSSQNGPFEFHQLGARNYSELNLNNFAEFRAKSHLVTSSLLTHVFKSAGSKPSYEAPIFKLHKINFVLLP